LTLTYSNYLAPTSAGIDFVCNFVAVRCNRKTFTAFIIEHSQYRANEGRNAATLG